LVGFQVQNEDDKVECRFKIGEVTDSN